MTATILARLEALSDDATATVLMRFFKTGPGEYGEGDRFRGIRVPVLRRLCREFAHCGPGTAAGLLASPWHEDRLLGLLLLVVQYDSMNQAGRQAIYELYCSHTSRINNWDLVDLSAPNIPGRHLSGLDRSPLYRFASSANIWERRIAIVSTFHFIRQSEFDDTLSICGMLLGDSEELIHKACGWMLREVGKRDRAVLEAFLERNYRQMPRVMLRYAIERFEAGRRQAYLKGLV
ncbi:MAG: DNA alkylation repair protein [Chlorobiaceae bacterium]|nr:DNA alkylation repair protein [Chlorobiaceae bacterium]NTW73731.1 DNA alkylation repair protein [Chlorobiaceae bacterium]